MLSHLFQKKSISVQYGDDISVEEYNRLRKAVGWNSCNPEKVSIALNRSDYLITAEADSHDHHFNWWLGFAPIRGTGTGYA
jgi:hypothetical protein